MELRVRLAKLRWPIERDYEGLSQEIGLDPFEGRGWRRFHPPATPCVAAHGFPASERARLPPPLPMAFLPAVRLPATYRPRGSPGPS